MSYVTPLNNAVVPFHQVFGASLTGTGSGFLRVGGECSTTIDANAWILPVVIPTGFTTLRITHMRVQLFNAGTGTGSFRYRIFSGFQATPPTSTNAYVDHLATLQDTGSDIAVNTQYDFTGSSRGLSLKQEIVGSVTGGGTRPIVTVLGYYL